MRGWLLRNQEENFIVVPYKRPSRKRISRASNGGNADPALESVLSHRASLAQKIEKQEAFEEFATLWHSYLKILVEFSALSGRNEGPSPDSVLPPFWSNAFRAREVVAASPAVRAEVAAACFQLGALRCHIAARADLATSEGLKLALNSFQAAAAAFSFLGNHVSPSLQGGGADVSAACCSLLSTLMLGQAQECFWQKATNDGRSAALRSSIAMQVSQFYEEARVAATSAPLCQLVPKWWGRHLHTKAALFHAEALYQLSVDLQEKSRFGEEIARLLLATDALAHAKQRRKGLAGRSMSEQEAALLAKLERAVQSRLVVAKEENLRYHVEIPPKPEKLGPVKSTPLISRLAPASVVGAEVAALFAPEEQRQKQPAKPPSPLPESSKSDEAAIGALRSWSTSLGDARAEAATPEATEGGHSWFRVQIAGLRLNRLQWRGHRTQPTGTSSRP